MYTSRAGTVSIGTSTNVDGEVSSFQTSYPPLTWLLDASGVTYAYGSGIVVTTETDVATAWPTTVSTIKTLQPPPTCTQTSCTIATKAPDCRLCEVQGGSVELLYWADMATNNDWQTATAMTDNHTAVTAKFKNYTLTSPTVYISFQTAYATNACGSQVGGAHPGALLSIHPTDLFSVQAQNDFFTSNLASGAVSTFYQSASFDFHDLTGFPRPEAYFAQPRCFANGCTIVRSDDYRPYLVLPSQVRALDLAWKTCGLDFRGSWDPPIALQPGGVVDAVTTETPATYIATAMPESTGEKPAKDTATMNS
ncbi:hypothetical protein LTR95_013409, partial [Oleoguttula sp. CCFEE 5521]